MNAFGVSGAVFAAPPSREGEGGTFTSEAYPFICVNSSPPSSSEASSSSPKRFLRGFAGLSNGWPPVRSGGGGGAPPRFFRASTIARLRPRLPPIAATARGAMAGDADNRPGFLSM